MNGDILVMMAAWAVGAFINGLTGMGGTLIALPLITFFVSSKTAVVVSMLTGTFVGLLTFFLYWRYISIKEVLGFWIPALPGIVLGVQILKAVDMELLELLLCSIIVVHIVVQLVQDWLGTCMAPRRLMKYLCGFAAGFFGGSIGINGPVMAMYASLMCMDKDKARGFFSSSTPSGLISIVMVAAGGLIGKDVLTGTAWAAPAALAGVICARPFAKKIRQQTFHNALLILLGIAALSLFWRTLPYLRQMAGQ